MCGLLKEKPPPACLHVYIRKIWQFLYFTEIAASDHFAVSKDDCLALLWSWAVVGFFYNPNHRLSSLKWTFEIALLDGSGCWASKIRSCVRATPTYWLLYFGWCFWLTSGYHDPILLYPRMIHTWFFLWLRRKGMNNMKLNRDHLTLTPAHYDAIYRHRHLNALE